MFEDYSLPVEWLLKWLLAIVVMVFYWHAMVGEMRRNKQIPARIVLVFLFSLIQIFETGFLVRTLQEQEFHTFGFWWSLLLPTVVFWVNLAVFLFGVIRSIRKSVGIGRFNPIRGFRVFRGFHCCIPIGELTFALAYASKIGIAMAAARALVLAYQVWAFWPKRKGTRKNRERARERKYA